MSTENDLSTPRQKAIFIVGFIFSVLSILAVIWIPISVKLNLIFNNEVIFLVVVGILGAFAITGLVLNSIAMAKAKKTLSLIGILLSIIVLLFDGFYILILYVLT